MTRALLMLGAASLALSAPAAAQHVGHHMPAPKAAPAKKAPPKRATAPKKRTEAAPAKKVSASKRAAPKRAPARKAAPVKARAPAPDPHAGHRAAAAADPHAGHDAPPPAPVATDPHAGHQNPAPAVDAHAGHQMQAPAADPHAGHDVGNASVDPPVTPPPAAALSGPEDAADIVWGAGPMATARREMNRMHGAMRAYRLLIDRMELRTQRGREGYAVDAEAWYGGDIDKFWIKAESEGTLGDRFEGAEIQALWSHAIDPWFDVQAGIRYDLRRGSDRAHLVVGSQGLAPYWIEVDAAAFLSDRGDVTARVEAEHDVRITQKLIVQPRVEIQFALQDVPDEMLGGGLAEASAGVRIRYQVSPLVAPYVGVEYERSFGDSRRFRRLADESLGGLRLLAGVRTWF